MNTWLTGKPLEYMYLFAPAELVVMRIPRDGIPYHPPQAISSVGASHLTQLHSGSRQFVGCHNKTTKAETTAVKTIPANTLETLFRSQGQWAMRILARNTTKRRWRKTETQRLYLGQRTAAWLKTEMIRIRDFFAHSFASPDADQGMVLLQEGGDIAECALAFSDKDLWGSFQELILDEANTDLQPKH